MVSFSLYHSLTLSLSHSFPLKGGEGEGTGHILLDRIVGQAVGEGLENVIVLQERKQRARQLLEGERLEDGYEWPPQLAFQHKVLPPVLVITHGQVVGPSSRSPAD